MLLKWAQLLFLILPLPAAVLALIIAERFGWKGFIAPIVGILSCYAAGVYLVVVGRKGNWQESLANTLRDRVLNRLPRLLALTIVLLAFLVAEVGLLLRGAVLDLRGQVLLENRPIGGPALIRLMGRPDPWHSGPDGLFRITIPDEGQTELTVTAEHKDLTGRRTVGRGAYRSFDIALDSRIVRPRQDERSKVLAVIGKGTVPSSLGRNWSDSDMPSSLPEGLTFFSAANPNSQALELTDARHGALTHFLLEAIKTRGLTHPRKIHEYVMAGVNAATHGVQFPRVDGDLGTPLPLTNGRFDRPEEVLAVAVGLTEYADASFRGPAFATRDAVAVYQWLLDAGVLPRNARLLLNGDATRAAVTAELARLSENGRSGSFVFIYYSGTGAVEEDHDGDEVDSLDEYMTCFDSYAANLAGTAVSDDWLNRALVRLGDKGSRVVVAIDAAFNVPAVR